MSIAVNQILDCIGLACPFPVVKTKKAVDSLNVGDVIEIQATDKGSIADLQGWAKLMGHRAGGICVR